MIKLLWDTTSVNNLNSSSSPGRAGNCGWWARTRRTVAPGAVEHELARHRPSADDINGAAGRL